MPFLQNLWSQLGGHGVQVVAVHLDSSQADAQTWMTTHGITFPVVQDDPPNPILSQYYAGGFTLPLIYIIDRNRVIQRVHTAFWAQSDLNGNLWDVIYMRHAVNLEMVMDVSDTMNDHSPTAPAGDPKLILMQQAATLITDFLHDHGQADDKMGLTWFTDDASEYVNPVPPDVGEKLLPIPTHTTDLKAQITAHATGTCTAMGAGLQTAFDTLCTSAPPRAVILCTDGMQNIDPKVAQVGGHLEIVDSGGWLCGGHSSVPSHPGVDLTTYNARVHTIGMGITATYEPLLQQIADATGGFYRATDNPTADLDLIYFLDLCNCLASGSPAVVHHHTGRFDPKEHEVVENFYLNRSVRKISVMLSWQKTQHGSLTFWLRAPDGTLLNLYNEMKQFETYCLATIYLPRQQDGKELPYVGKWQMIIRGETQNAYADYHAFVVAEDREVKYHIDYPRKSYKVGDILPIHVALLEHQKPIAQVHEIVMETSHLPRPLTELVTEYQVPHTLPESLRHRVYLKDNLRIKLEALQADPEMRKFLTPVRTEFSLLKKNLECKIGTEELLIPYTLRQPGLCSFKVHVQCETASSGPIHRVDMVSVHVT